MWQGSRTRPEALPPLTRRQRWAVVAVGVLIVLAALLFLFFSLNGLLVDRLWFESLGQLAVWDLRTFSRLLLWVPVSVGVFIAVLLSLWLALHSSPDEAKRLPRVRPERSPDRFRTANNEEMTKELLLAIDDAALDLPRRVIVLLLVGVGLLAAIWVGSTVSAGWQTLLLYQHQTTAALGGAAAVAGPGAAPTDASALDPIFGKPLTFYLFDLPFYRWASGFAGAVLDALIAVTGLAYLVLWRRSNTPPRFHLRAWHLGVLIALRLALGAVGFQLDKFSLVFSQSDYPYPSGVGATDAAVRTPAADLLTVLTIVVAVVVLIAIVRHFYIAAAAIFAVWIGVAVLAGVLAFVNQALFVNPNPLDQERAYISNDIAATRSSYGLGAWQMKSYPALTTLTAASLVSDADTFANARLWDYRPLGATLDQLQTVRQYYDFTDVDIDRYIIDGKQRQVMLSAREMALDKNPSVNNWLNQHFVYTHGYGVAMVPVSAVGSDGLPDLVIKDLPVVSEPGAPTINVPQVYFGERPSPWVITGAQTDEFDYPSNSGSSDATSRWSGSTGIKISDGINRLLLSIFTGDFVSLMTSPQITPDSQFLMRRTLTQRLGALAPFLTYDGDPYLVITSDGHLDWIVDAYTTSANYPLARAFEGLGLTGNANIPDTGFNYIRNSVKAVVDAYDGTTRLYVNDPTDPLVETWASIYPTLFSPLSEMPPTLTAHLRYPEGLFNVQSSMFQAYHVTEATTFYQGDNLWTLPANLQGQDQVLPGEAYYVQMRLPDADNTEYLLMQPMVPAKRPNMIAWIAARNDGAARGQVLVYQLPADTSIFGPAQIEARIDQTPEISAQVTLWDQSGSQVVRGNLIVVPVGGSFVYLEPIYLQSTSSAFPQFTKIVVATPEKVVWANNLADALQLAVAPGGGPVATPGPNLPNATPRPTPAPGGDALPPDINGLIAYANDHFKRAQAAIGSGDYVTYGHEMSLVQSALDQLATLTGGTSSPLPLLPAPTPGS